MSPRLAVALCHYPVLDPGGHVVTSAITNLDLHDLARSSATFGVAAAYAVSPVRKQREMIDAVIHHWVHGEGRHRCCERGDAFEVLRPAGSIQEVLALEAQAAGSAPLVVATSARAAPDTVSYQALRDRLATTPAVLLFGTARGLAPAALALAEVRLQPLVGPTPYNHLSVRSAIAIVLDRLRGS